MASFAIILTKKFKPTLEDTAKKPNGVKKERWGLRKKKIPAR
ncbi:MAG: hypothetical protein V7K57_00605 [Nostoc sp.]